MERCLIFELDQCCSPYVPLAPILSSEVPLEVTGNNNITHYFWIWRQQLELPNSVKGSGWAGKFFLAFVNCKLELILLARDFYCHWMLLLWSRCWAVGAGPTTQCTQQYAYLWLRTPELDSWNYFLPNIPNIINLLFTVSNAELWLHRQKPCIDLQEDSVNGVSGSHELNILVPKWQTTKTTSLLSLADYCPVAIISFKEGDRSHLQ